MSLLSHVVRCDLELSTICRLFFFNVDAKLVSSKYSRILTIGAMRSPGARQPTHTTEPGVADLGILCQIELLEASAPVGLPEPQQPQRQNSSAAHTICDEQSRRLAAPAGVGEAYGSITS